MPNLGLGLGLGSQGRGAPQKPSHDALCAAIADTKLVEVKYEGKALTLEPYAVFKTDSDTILSAVVLRSEDAALNRWEPQYFEVKKLKDEAVLETAFLPSAAFDPADLAGTVEVICKVEIV